MINAFTLLGSGELKKGIKVFFDSRTRPYLLVQMVKVYIEVTAPVVHTENVRLFQAQPCTNADKKALSGPRLIHKADWKGALLYIEASELYFDEDTSTPLPVNNAWPGAETYHRPFIERGPKGTKQRVQLLALEDGEIAIVADGRNLNGQTPRYRTFTCKRGALVGSKTTSLELAELLAFRASSHHRRQALVWAKYTLGELGHPRLWSAALEKKLQSVSFLKPAK